MQNPRKDELLYTQSNSITNMMDNSLLHVKDINHKYIIVGRRRMLWIKGGVICWICLFCVFVLCFGRIIDMETDFCNGC